MEFFKFWKQYMILYSEQVNNSTTLSKGYLMPFCMCTHTFSKIHKEKVHKIHMLQLHNHVYTVNKYIIHLIVTPIIRKCEKTTVS